MFPYLQNLNIAFEENNSLVNKIDSISKEKNIALNKIKSLKKKIILNEKENTFKKKKDSVSHVSHTNNIVSSFDKNEIHVLKNKIDCLVSTLSQYAFNHSKLESIFRKKQVPHMHAQTPWHTHAHHAHTITSMLECTHLHIAATKAI